MDNETLLIISNNEEISTRISSKVKLLRKYDKIQTATYIQSISALNTMVPTVIVVYCEELDSIDIIKEIKQIKSLKKVPVIYVSESYNEENLCKAFNNGIDDFFFLSDTDTVILMRILLSIQKADTQKRTESNNRILIETNLFETNTEILKEEPSELILNSIFKEIIEKDIENTVFMYAKPIVINNKQLNIGNIGEKIKQIQRNTDIISAGKDSGFYILLYNSNLEGAKSVSEKIRNKLNGICDIYFAVAPITKSFGEIKAILYQNIQNQIKTGKQFDYINDKNKTEQNELTEEVQI